MSLHPTLKGSRKIRVQRNVLKRYERIDALREAGRYQEGQKVWGLPKTRTR